MSEDVRSSGTGTSPGLSKNFRGGLTIALLALALLLMTFYISNPIVPRTLAIVLGLIGVATAAGLIPVRASQDYYGGLMLVWLAILAMVASAELPGQRGFAFGPGTAPRLFSGMLAFIGAWVAVVGVFSEGPSIERYKFRGPALVILSIVLFAMIIRPFGLVLASFLTFMLAITGSSEMRVIEGAIGAALMTFFCVVLFVWLLNLPFQLWPQANAFDILVGDAATFLRLIFGPLLKFLGVM
jgi:hypothetical protein